MAGLYIHIPFCKQKCIYCNFFSVASLRHKDDMVSAILKELVQKKEYLRNQVIETIYIGGGTPSMLSVLSLSEILEMVYAHYQVSDSPEITLEANPDDLSLDYLTDLSKTPINRLSIGVQSFDEQELIFLHRGHTSNQAEEAIKKAISVGFTQLSVDLIYGIPHSTMDSWKNNIALLLSYPITHISAYCLTVEDRTPLQVMISKNKLPTIKEELAIEQYHYFIHAIEQAGFEAYEISNFAKNKHYAKHNTNYWKRISYLGIGPSAHSYNIESRQWNTAHIVGYIQQINDKLDYVEKEVLTPKQQYNEYVLTAIRTQWGVSKAILLSDFGNHFFVYFSTQVQPFLMSGDILYQEGSYTLSPTGKLLADHITVALLYEE